MNRARWGTTGDSPGRAVKERRGGIWSSTRVGRTAVKAAAAVGAASLGLLGGISAAHAAPGDQSAATGTFLGGSILSLVDLGAVAEIDGAAATNDGTQPTVTDYNTLDLTALGTVNVTATGGIQIPVDLGSLGVVGQYAQADPDGSSVGASGAVGSGGVIGTGAPATGPLSISLGGAVDALGLGTAVTDEILDVDLTLDAVSARASQEAPNAAVGEYTIAGGQLVIDSATLSDLTADLNAAVGGLQGSLDNVDALVNSGVLGALSSLGVQSNLTVGTTSLTGAISGLLTGQLTSDAYPGVIIDLSSGEIIVDLDEIQPLNGLAPGTNILGPDTVAEIQASVVGLVDGLVDEINEAVLAAVRGITITGGVVIPPILVTPQIPVLSVNTTVGALLDGNTSGIVVLGGLTIPGGIGPVAAAIVAPIEAVVANVAGAVDTVVTSVTTILSPALGQVVPALVTVTVNNQTTTDDGVFSITGAIVTILPGSIATTIELANATVGPNVLDDNADVTIATPEDGAEFFVPDAEDVSDVTITGSGEEGAQITVTIEGEEPQVATVVDGEWTVTFPDLPVGEYTATATQNVDGTTATVDFAVVEAPDVTITAPTPDQIFVVPGVDDTTDVTVEGSGFPGSDVEVVVDGQTQTVTVGEGGTWTATFTDLPIGDYTATATQEFDGSTAEVDFSVAETPDVVIEVPADGTEIAVGQADDVTTVTVSGEGSPGATVTVVLDNGDTETDVVAEDGTWSVDFVDLPIGDYTATATQDVDGSEASVDFSVVLADPVAIVAPADGADFVVGEPDATQSVTVSGTGQAGAEIEVDVPGLGTQTTTVDELGAWSVTFAEVPVGEFTATATQDIDGTTDEVSFSVSAEAADVLDIDADALDVVDADADAADADALDVLDIDVTDVLDALDIDADADVLDADADVLDIDADADGLDVDLVDADALDIDVLDADADVLDIDADAVDADVADADAADADALDVLDIDVTDVLDALDIDADADVLDADADVLDIDADADGLDVDLVDADALDIDVLDADADVLDIDADAVDADVADADAADADALDVLDIDVTDVLDALDIDADADVLDADADVLDIDADADGLDLDVIDADALDIDILDADADVLDIDADAVDVDVADADAADADALDVLDIDVTDVLDALDIDADADVLDADADVLDIDADADGLDLDVIDADALDIDILDADADVLDIDADAVDADVADADAADADAADADADADALDIADALDQLDIADALDQLDIADALDQLDIADALDQLDIADALDQLDIADALDQLDIADALDQLDIADALDQLDIADALDQLDIDALDADVTDADATDADAIDADVADADADAADADAADADAADAVDAADVADADAIDADATDAADVADADAVDAIDAADADAADAVDADATDADATDGDVSSQPRADVQFTQIVRGTGVTQTVILTGFQPGETISATVLSTPFELTPVTADASGSARMTFVVGADFELGAHRVEVRGSVSGEIPTDRENTAFTVIAKQVPAATGGGGRLPATGADLNGPLTGGIAAALILAGAALWTMRRRSTPAGEQR